MERSTGKTMDCYIEFATMKDAQATVERLNRVYDAGSAPRMGSRHVDLELSTPAKLLKATFPRAKCIAWEDGNPVQLVNKDSWSTGFDGFLTDEELFCLTRLAEQPHRVCPNSCLSFSFHFTDHLTHCRAHLQARFPSVVTNRLSALSGR